MYKAVLHWKRESIFKKLLKRVIRLLIRILEKLGGE